MPQHWSSQLWDFTTLGFWSDNSQTLQESPSDKNTFWWWICVICIMRDCNAKTCVWYCSHWVTGWHWPYPVKMIIQVRPGIIDDMNIRNESIHMGTISILYASWKIFHVPAASLYEVLYHILFLYTDTRPYWVTCWQRNDCQNIADDHPRIKNP